MLIGISPLLGPDLLHALRAMGHGDEIAFVDGNYPAAEHARRLIRADGIPLLPILQAVLAVLPVEQAFRAALNNDPAQVGEIHHHIDALMRENRMVATALPGDQLYPRIRSAYAIVATSEPALFANVILRKAALCPPTL
ncbi:RbsD/FucU family protein [Tabrizicola oligotrophica]|uniref:Transporter n=1 Tax=Tabrizicola oligotrophica TaxID=2710650 RepID=A0A6M0QQI9_9RHOB|nr:RbsD/FucU domain-containing protein [Tabrizicola oligotrophica]NEY89769.1 transporter [Tabrizicola oligotrophica]